MECTDLKESGSWGFLLNKVAFLGDSVKPSDSLTIENTCTLPELSTVTEGHWRT
jgi:hypothetical protein